MKLVIEIDPRNDYEIIDAIEMLKSLPDCREPQDDLPSLDQGNNGARLQEALDRVVETPTGRAILAPVATVATEADAIAAMQDLVKRHGAEGFAKAREVLTEFSAARVTELAPEQRAAFIEKARAA